MSNKDLLLFEDLKPEADGKPLGVGDEKGINVELEKYYEIIADKGYNSLSPEDTTDFLSKLYAAGEEDKIKAYFITTLRHPYLCRSRGDKEAFPEDEYARYYYTAVAVRRVNYTLNYFAHAAARIHEGILGAALRTREYEAALALVISANKMRAKLSDKAYKDSIPALDEAAKFLDTRYLVYTPGKGDYKVAPEEYIKEIGDLAESGKRNIVGAKTGISAVEDTAAALDIEAFIMPDIKEGIDSVKREAAENRRVFTVLFTTFLKNLKDKEAREAFTRIYPAGVVRDLLADVGTYEEAEAERAGYIHNLIDYGDSTYYVLKKVDEYKKAHYGKGIL